MRIALCCTVLWLMGGSSVSFAEPDILVADFESETYGDWQVEGAAFGPGPAQGKLPGQMNVTGYQGKRLVNSFYEGDGSTGRLTSPPLRIDRKYMTFLLGGGGHVQKTCIQLLVDEKVIRSAVGPNTEPGGSEELTLHVWDVSEFLGKMATIQIVDEATGGWGHINVDQIQLTDEKPKVPEFATREWEFTVDKQFLVIPIQNGAKQTQLTLEVDGQPIRHYDTELAVSPETVDWYAYFTIDSYRGATARVKVTAGTEEGFALIRQADTVPGSAQWYSEPLRPQFRFSQAVGWNNDPNGMVYYDGEWHLFLQHNPVGWKWGNMTWAHAVSPDLVHWKQLPHVLFPKTMASGACFSGGAVVDYRNTGGFQTGDENVIVAFLTDTGAGEALAYSNDRGRTFTWYEHNPVVRHRGRDPKVIWYSYDENDTVLNEEAHNVGGHWVMAVYDEHDTHKQNIAFYTSVDLKNWDEQSHLPGYFECPEIFELPVPGDPERSRWVVFAADARYALGQFDGRTFTPDHEGKHRVHYGSYYASQTFSQPPKGRRIQIGWARIEMPNMPFNQAFTFPHQLTLRKTEDGIRLFAEPIPEIEKLYLERHVAENRQLEPGQAFELPLRAELFDLHASFELGDAERVGLEFGGHRVVYDAKAQQLNEAPLKPIDGRIHLQILADRPIVEVCGNEGRVYITAPRNSGEQSETIKAFAEGGNARLIRADLHRLQSIWEHLQP